MKDFSIIQNKATKFMDKILGSGVETSITYKMFASNSYNDTTGMNETTYNDYSVDAIKVDASLQAQLASSVMAGISFGAGQIIYLIKQEDMPRTAIYSPDVLKDIVVDGGEEKQVKTAVPILNTFVKIQV